MVDVSDAREWLRANGYPELADQIDAIMARWRERGLRTRRNWWEALAGKRDGRPRVIEGVTFPVLAAVRARQGLPPVPSAIALPSGGGVPDAVVQARWAEKRSGSRRNRTAVAERARKRAVDAVDRRPGVVKKSAVAAKPASKTGRSPQRKK